MDRRVKPGDDADADDGAHRDLTATTGVRVAADMAKYPPNQEELP